MRTREGEGDSGRQRANGRKIVCQTRSQPAFKIHLYHFICVYRTHGGSGGGGGGGVGGIERQRQRQIEGKREQIRETPTFANFSMLNLLCVLFYLLFLLLFASNNKSPKIMIIINVFFEKINLR